MTSPPLVQVLDAADLRDLLEKMPDGLQARLGRGPLRPGVRLVILDEPFRGLDRQRRRELLAWLGAGGSSPTASAVGFI
jgi:ATP-binding cassette subfamily B protein